MESVERIYERNKGTGLYRNRLGKRKKEVKAIAESAGINIVEIPFKDKDKKKLISMLKD